MRQTILTCDKCKQVVEQLWQIGFYVRYPMYGLNPPESYDTPTWNPQDWCRECCIKYGLIKIEKREPIKELTFDDLVCDMLEKLLNDRMGNNL